MKAKVVFIVVLIMVVLVLSAGSLNVLNSGFSESRQVLLMRDIGHQLLKSSGDSTSRVLPVRKIDESTFLIEFENSFSFLPDSLVDVVHRTLSTSEFPAQYEVHVLSCASRNIVYGYEISSYQSTVPCLGRAQPSACYAVQITFAKPFIPYNYSFLSVFAVVGITVFGFVVFGIKRKQESNPTVQPLLPNSGDHIVIGDFNFYPETGVLKHPKETIELSRKETKVLKLFADNPNQLLLRDTLLKEGWENEGVITGRSLDMFVSKLRKKLTADPSVKLVNIHGKGYRLEV